MWGFQRLLPIINARAQGGMAFSCALASIIDFYHSTIEMKTIYFTLAFWGMIYNNHVLLQRLNNNNSKFYVV